MNARWNPRLIFIGGPVKDSTFALPVGEVSVGRDALNLLSIPDPSVSRRHCVIVQDEQGFKIRDLNSRNGTLVNGTPVREHQLRHGDQITIGDSLCLFLVDEDEDAPVSAGRVNSRTVLRHFVPSACAHPMFYTFSPTRSSVNFRQRHGWHGI